MGIAAGGFIKQAIVEDSGKREWDTTQTKVFNVQVLNSHHFRAVTGFAPPPSCVTAQTYAQHGYPFYSMYEEPTVVAGNFSGVRSIGQMEGNMEAHVVPPTVSIGGIPTVSPFDYLRTNASFRDFAQMMGRQPEMLEPVLQHIGTLAPLLADLIAAHPDDFLDLLTELSMEQEEPEGIVEESIEVPIRAPRVEVSFFNPSGPASKFRSVAEMKKEIEEEIKKKAEEEMK